MNVAQTLKDAYNLSNPVQPLPPGDPRYVDCTPVRGNEDVVTQMLNALSRWTWCGEPRPGWWQNTAA